MFSSVNKYQTAVRLAAKAWMMFVETASPAALRSFQRMEKLIQKLRVPSGPHRAELWIDIQSIAEHAGKLPMLEKGKEKGKALQKGEGE